VYPALPENLGEGIWIRYVEFDKKNYLLVEQRIPDSPKKEDTSQGAVISLSTEGATFAELDKEKLERDGIKIVSSYSSTAMNKVGNGYVNYKISTFIFEKNSNFKNPIKINGRYFSNFPKQVHTEEVVIKS
jgi:hypothetical protein